MKTKIKNICLVLTLFVVSLTVNAQKNYTLDPKSTFTVNGTSTMHDWEMKSTGKTTGTSNMTVTANKLEHIQAISIILPAESIKSEKTKMDKIAYETLKTNKNKNITFTLKSAEKVNETTWNLTGTYTIAGVSKLLKTQVKTTVTNGVVTLEGSQKITFTQFGMKSPTAMLGAIKTGEDLTIKFKASFK
ncbi:MAG TPA: YceI family protein [Flavobacterium sp.]